MVALEKKLSQNVYESHAGHRLNSLYHIQTEVILLKMETIKSCS